MTRADLLDGNVDLLARAGALLAAMPTRRLEVATTLAGTTLTVTLTVAGADRADLYLDDRPISSEDLSAAPLTITILDAAAGEQLRTDAYHDGSLVASRRTTI